jgi:hypothetical protein
MASPGLTLPALSLGGVASLRVMTIRTLTVRIAGSAFAPVSYIGDAVCLEVPGGGLNCADGGQHASQIGLVQVELVNHRVEDDEHPIFGLVGVGVYFAYEAIKTHPPPGVSSVQKGLVMSAGVGRRLFDRGVRGRAEARLSRFQSVFGEHQWGLMLGFVLN